MCYPSVRQHYFTRTRSMTVYGNSLVSVAVDLELAVVTRGTELEKV